MTPKEALKIYFGYDSFRPGQEEIINSILAGRDALAIMPTGAGKSVCYQIPALLLPGITLVISPLISLMQDQVKALNEAGIHAAYINSSLTETQISKALSRAAEGTYKIIYVAPERLESYGFIQFASAVQISMVTVDEAHCISQWGQDFRPSYLKIVEFIQKLQEKPIISAFTATATDEVKTDIECILKLKNPNTVVTGFDRENLYYRVEHISGKKKDAFVIDYVKKHAGESGIIYCATRKNVDTLYEELQKEGVSVSRYHAGLSNEVRKVNQEDFIFDRVQVIVATNAFGMGIDKSNVRYVIHYNMPQSMENYYQEAGRAGRDGEKSECILLFSAQDVMIDKFLLEKKDFTDINPDDVELLMQRDVERLRIMEGYCKTTLCLRSYILNYFGERTSVACGNCGNCHREFHEVDMTADAKWVINCLYETRGRYGLNIVIGTLLGANRARLKETGTVNYKSYGSLRHRSEGEIRLLIEQMITDGYIIQTADKYSVLQIGDISVLKDENTKITVREIKEKKQEANKVRKQRSTDALTADGYKLFDKLRELRLTIAREEGMPPYIIFNDKTLVDMCVKVPFDKNSMLNVSGVAERKFDKYGQRFIDAIQTYVQEHPGSTFSIPADTEETDLSYDMPKKKSKGKKSDFYLNHDDAGKFPYKEYYYISDIKDHLNEITSGENVKKVTLKAIWEFLVSEGLVVEENVEGSLKKVPTEKGREMGIIAVDRVSQYGFPYQLLQYPIGVQEIVVKHFVLNLE